MFLAEIVRWLIIHHHVHIVHLWENGRITFEQMYAWAVKHHFVYTP